MSPPASAGALTVECWTSHLYCGVRHRLLSSLWSASTSCGGAVLSTSSPPFRRVVSLLAVAVDTAEHPIPSLSKPIARCVSPRSARPVSRSSRSLAGSLSLPVPPSAVCRLIRRLRRGAVVQHPAHRSRCAPSAARLHLSLPSLSFCSPSPSISPFSLFYISSSFSFFFSYSSSPLLCRFLLLSLGGLARRVARTVLADAPIPAQDSNLSSARLYQLLVSALLKLYLTSTPTFCSISSPTPTFSIPLFLNFFFLPAHLTAFSVRRLLHRCR